MASALTTRRIASRTAALLAALLILALPASATAKPRVPFGFLGVNAGGLLAVGDVDLDSEYRLMLDSGVQSVRQPFGWDFSQPYASWAGVPPDQVGRFRDEDGIPTDWSFIDRQVAAAARRGMPILAIVHGTPWWAARHPGEFSSPPRDPSEYARFVTALARRYGPAGRFWRERPDLPRVPVRDWQIWNEPSLAVFWSDRRNWPRDYVALVRAGRTALRRVDPGARVVLAGLPNKSWLALKSIYRAGGGRLFDVVAIHPFTTGVDGVVKILELNRAVMARNGDARKPLMVTETAWTSSKGRTSTDYGWETTQGGQADKVRHLMPLLARVRGRLRIERVYWYTWLTADARPDYSFDYAGLRWMGADGTVRSKPALAAYRRVALELSGCRRKGASADRCAAG